MLVSMGRSDLLTLIILWVVTEAKSIRLRTRWKATVLTQLVIYEKSFPLVGRFPDEGYVRFKEVMEVTWLNV